MNDLACPRMINTIFVKVYFKFLVSMIIQTDADIFEKINIDFCNYIR